MRSLRVALALATSAAAASAPDPRCWDDGGPRGDSLHLLQAAPGSARKAGVPHAGTSGEPGSVLQRGDGLAAWRSAALRVPSEDLYPPGRVPYPMPASTGPEAFVPGDPNDPVAIRCAPGDTSGKAYYNVTVPRLYSFPVDPGSAGFKDAAVVVIPGGGHQFLAWNKEGTDIALWLNTLGYSAFVLKYRAPDTAPFRRSLQDAQRALSLVRSKAGRLGINASRLGVMGFSAGGLLGSMVAHDMERAYDRIDDVDDHAFRPDFSMLVYGMGFPYHDNFTVPTFLASAANDPCVPSLALTTYYQALLAHKIKAELHMYSDGHHGYGRCSMWTTSGEWDPVCKWPQDAEYYLDNSVMGHKRPLPAALG